MSKFFTFTENATSPTCYIAGSGDSSILTSLSPSTKLIGSNFDLGSFGVTGVKRSFSPKTLLLLQITWHCHVTHAYASATYPLQNLSEQNSIWGHLGSQGSKGNFYQKYFSSYILHCMLTWLMYINKLEKLYSIYCMKFWYGVLWGPGVKNMSFIYF